MPLYAFGLAYIFKWASETRAFRKIPVPAGARPLIPGAVALAAVAMNTVNAYSTTIEPKLSVYHVAIAQAIKEKAPADAMVWSWWDHGYFLEYYTERDVIIHGGTQTPERMFIAAFPLAASDPQLARNWMNFFAARGTTGLDHVIRHVENPEKAFAFLIKCLSQPSRLGAILEAHHLQYEHDWREYLFPRENVFVYLSSDLVDKAYWWFYFGSGADHTRGGIHPFITRLFRGRFSIDETNGVLMDGANRIPISQLYHMRFMPRPVVLRRQEFNRRSGAAVLWGRDLQIAYVMDQHMHRSLFTQLLLLHPLHPPLGFEPLKYAPFQGGAWKVQ